MSGNKSPQSVIDGYKRRQKMMPYIVGGGAVLLVIIGIAILVVWLQGSNKPGIVLFPSATPTMTSTFTPTPVTPTATPTQTETPTNTPTITETATPSGPFEYTVESGDTCWGIADKFKVDVEVLQAINPTLTTTCNLQPGNKILIPLANQELPTATPIPANMRGKIEYTVKSGDTLDIIARKFNTTVDSILADNKLTDRNKINLGDKLMISVNIVTPTSTLGPTSTPAAGVSGTPAATKATGTQAATTAATQAPTKAAATQAPTKAATAAASATKAPTKAPTSTATPQP